MINSEKFHKFINEQNKALKLLYDNNLHMPFLMILYTTIDIFGYISGNDFDGFVNKYMSEKLEDVTAVDLWGARCGILHSNSPESRHSKKGKARQILYCWGRGDLYLAKKIIEKSGKEDRYVAVKIEELYRSLVYAINKYIKELDSNPKLLAVCEQRIGLFYGAIAI